VPCDQDRDLGLDFKNCDRAPFLDKMVEVVKTHEELDLFNNGWNELG